MSIRTAVRSSDVFMFDPDAEQMSRQSITALQTARLKRTLEYAYANVEHYRRKFQVAGVHPDDFSTIADITRFPFTSNIGSKLKHRNCGRLQAEASDTSAFSDFCCSHAA